VGIGELERGYREERRGVKKWWILILGLFIVTGVIFTGLRYVGLIGSTIVEREVFKNSFQYKEARKSEIATYNAQLAEIDRKLSMSSLDSNTRANMEAQAASIRILLATARSK